MVPSSKQNFLFECVKLLIINKIMSDINNNKNFLMQQFMWIGISLGISFLISYYVQNPFISIPIIIVIFILLSFYMRNRAMRKFGLSGQTMFGANNSVNYYCMSCGTKHNQYSCPRCGSKMKRVGT